MKYIFQSDRLGFRHWTDADRIPFATMNADPVVMEYFPDVLTTAESNALVDRAIAHFADKGFGPYAVDRLDLDVPTFIGFIGLFTPSFELDYGSDWVEIGWRLHPDHWGIGLASEGAQRVIHYALEDLALPAVYSFTTITNTRSERVMQKIGMEHIGYFDHPKLDADDPLVPHTLYRVERH